MERYNIKYLNEDEKKVLKAIAEMQEDGHYAIEGGGIIFNGGNTDNLPVSIEVLNIKWNYVEWYYCNTVKEAKEFLHEQKVQFVEIGKTFPKTRIKFHGMIAK